MNAKKAFAFFLSLLISVCIFADYAHVSFSLSSAVGVNENARYRFLGSDAWVEVKDKSKVSMCIDPTQDNRIVIETSGENKEWKSLCTASIVAVPKDGTGTSAKWMWNQYASNVTGARWSITGGKWNYISLSDVSALIENIAPDKLTIFTVQTTQTGDEWDDIAVHGIIPVTYNEASLTPVICSICYRGTVFVNAPAIDKSTTVNEAPAVVEEKKSSTSWLIYGGYTKSERELIYTDDTLGIKAPNNDGFEVGTQFMFTHKVGLDLSFNLERHLYDDRRFNENAVSIGIVYRDEYTSFFSPYVMASFQETFFKDNNKKGNYPTVRVAVGIDLWLQDGFGVYGGLESSMAFLRDKAFRPDENVDAVNFRTGMTVGARMRFGMGGAK